MRQPCRAVGASRPTFTCPPTASKRTTPRCRPTCSTRSSTAPSSPPSRTPRPRYGHEPAGQGSVNGRMLTHLCMWSGWRDVELARHGRPLHPPGADHLHHGPLCRPHRLHHCRRGLPPPRPRRRLPSNQLGLPAWPPPAQRFGTKHHLSLLVFFSSAPFVTLADCELVNGPHSVSFCRRLHARNIRTSQSAPGTAIDRTR